MTLYLSLAKDLAYQAGELIRKNFSLGMKKEWKDDQTPLTKTDLAVNKLVIRKVSEKYPDHSILGEEEKVLKRSDYIWVCDPIDGTVPFSHGYPTFTFSLALVYKGNPVVGVVYDPILDRLYYGEKGKGAFLNKDKIHVSVVRNLKNQMINLDADFSDFYGRFQKIVFKKHSLYVSILYCASYGAVLTAVGEFVAEIYASVHPWDGAAAKIIVEEGGGKVTDIEGKDQRYDREINGFIASNKVCHQEILNLIQLSRKGGI